MDESKYIEKEKKSFDVHISYIVEQEYPELMDQLLDGYEQAFPDIDTAQIQRCYTRDELQQVLNHPDYAKIITVNKNIVYGCCIVATQAEHMKDAYANPRRYSKELRPEECIYYVTALFATRSGQKENISKLAEKLAEFAISNNAALGFDYCDSNPDLPHIFEHVAQKAAAKQGGSIETKKIGWQAFALMHYNKGEEK
ncbi:MAG TPA: hypothetical protein VJB65_03700 [Patescibacteria group bacterium]|nr:hypothetical protein [Patescibacteria group bacterium]